MKRFETQELKGCFKEAVFLLQSGQQVKRQSLISQAKKIVFSRHSDGF